MLNDVIAEAWSFKSLIIGDEYLFMCVFVCVCVNIFMRDEWESFFASYSSIQKKRCFTFKNDCWLFSRSCYRLSMKLIMACHPMVLVAHLYVVACVH